MNEINEIREEKGKEGERGKKKGKKKCKGGYSLVSFAHLLLNKDKQSNSVHEIIILFLYCPKYYNSLVEVYFFYLEKQFTG